MLAHILKALTAHCYERLVSWQFYFPAATLPAEDSNTQSWPLHMFHKTGKGWQPLSREGREMLSPGQNSRSSCEQELVQKSLTFSRMKSRCSFTSQQLCVTKGCRFPKSLNFSFPQYRESTILYRHLQDPIPWYAFLVLLFGSTGCCLYIQFCTEEIFFSPINTGKMFLFWTVTGNRPETHTMFIPQLTAARIQTVETSSRSHFFCQVHCPEFSRRKSLFPSL